MPQQTPNQVRIRPPATCPAIRVVMMPRDTNAANTIFGGVLLSYIDQAGFVEARRQANHRYVTVSMREVVFHEPVFVGDVVSFNCETARIGRTSITVRVTVVADRYTGPARSIKVTEAEVVFVAIDEDCKPIPVFDD
ncbi:MAG: acyl-CoA thioesterase [Phycisphaerales bacterium]|nr:acyl-CoA thioesterase [Phycisphaerales bacterium]